MSASPAAIRDDGVEGAAPGVSPLRAAVREHRVFLALIVLYLAAAVFADLLGFAPGMSRGLRWLYAYIGIPPFALICAPIALAVDYVGRVARAERGGARLTWALRRELWREARRATFSARRVAEVVVVLLLLPLFLTVFGAWKAAIPILNPFSWDAPLARLDAALHLGRQPWELLHGWLGRPGVTVALDRVYSTWLMVMVVVPVWQAWSRPSALRRRFFLAFALSWIVLGTGMAVGLSSGGPVYFARLTGDPDPFTGLFAYLHGVHAQTPLDAVGLQRWLWIAYTQDDPNPFARISAMPSMHLALTTLYVLVGWRTRRWLGAAFAVYAGLILVGSVHLGWHYAVDGYVSILGMLGIWWVSGRVVGDRPGIPLESSPEGPSSRVSVVSQPQMGQSRNRATD